MVSGQSDLEPMMMPTRGWVVITLAL
jgi:hypothetical protein